MQEKVIREIMQRMSLELTGEQMKSLESVLIVTLHQYHIQEASRKLTVSESGWERMLRTFLAVKDVVFLETIVASKVACPLVAEATTIGSDEKAFGKFAEKVAFPDPLTFFEAICPH